VVADNFGHIWGVTEAYNSFSQCLHFSNINVAKGYLEQHTKSGLSGGPICWMCGGKNSTAIHPPRVRIFVQQP